LQRRTLQRASLDGHGQPVGDQRPDFLAGGTGLPIPGLPALPRWIIPVLSGQHAAQGEGTNPGHAHDPNLGTIAH